MHRYVSPVFLAPLVASFILWYIAKLSYTYTTEQTVRVSVDGQPFEVTCVVEGVGTNLFGYRVYMNKTRAFRLRNSRRSVRMRRGTRVNSSSTPSRCKTPLRRGSATSRSFPSGTFPKSTFPVTHDEGRNHRRHRQRQSTVCRLFARLGVAVYDSDAGAKRLMTEDAELRRRITDRFGAEAYADGTLNRTYLAGRVFSEAQALADLNAIVHPAVRADFAAWAEQQEGDYVILESALLFDAGFDACVDRTVAVLAPEARASNAPAAATGAHPGRSASASPPRRTTIR